MKYRLSLVAIIIVLIAGAFGGATYAFFTDVAANTGNTFGAGTVEIVLKRDMGDIPAVGPLYYTERPQDAAPTTWKFPTHEWAPGDAVQRILIIQNTGSLDAKVTSIGASMSGGDRLLADKLQIKITDSSGKVLLPALPNTTLTIGQLIDHPEELESAVPITVRQRLTQLRFLVSLPTDADNSYQGKSLNLDFNVFAEQVANN